MKPYNQYLFEEICHYYYSIYILNFIQFWFIVTIKRFLSPSEKPFDSKELVARVKAVLRRYKPAAAAPVANTKDADEVSYPGLTVNKTNYSVVYKGARIEMPPKELELLYFLASSPNHVFTREQLLNQIWGYEYAGDTRTVDVHIKRIREKINDTPEWRISTIWGIGYKFELL